VREESRLREVALAALAYKDLLFQMHLEMFVNIALLGVSMETPADRTHEWLLLHVGPEVVEEVAPFLELSIAVLVVTEEYLSPFVRPFFVVFDIFIRL
jgi:hypothetical protein